MDNQASTIMTNLIYQCTMCNKDNQRLVRLYNPEDFSKKGTGSILAQCWCKHCSAPQVFRYGFYRDEQGEIQTQVIKHFSPDSVFVHQKAETGITVRPRSGKSKKG
jgi:hypothetical protein